MTQARLLTPIPEEAVRRLKVGDIVYASGIMFTARDQAHRRALELARQGKPLPVDFRGMIVFHCGPVVRRKDGVWEILAAGPTTSSRMEAVEAEFIEKLGPRVIVGKGGMGSRTAEAMKRYGAVYCDFTGGAGVVAARAVERVEGVEWIDLGIPEAVWILRVREFGPITVAIDASGRNLHQEVADQVERNRVKVYQSLGVPQ
jgi:fumarate hydratase subunit beta